MDYNITIEKEGEKEMEDKKRKEIKNKIRNTLQSYIINDMFEYTIYNDKNCTCEDIGETYVEMMTELINEYTDNQHLYLDYINRNK